MNWDWDWWVGIGINELVFGLTGLQKSTFCSEPKKAEQKKRPLRKSKNKAVGKAKKSTFILLFGGLRNTCQFLFRRCAAKKQKETGKNRGTRNCRRCAAEVRNFPALRGRKAKKSKKESLGPRGPPKSKRKSKKESLGPALPKSKKKNKKAALFFTALD